MPGVRAAADDLGRTGRRALPRLHTVRTSYPRRIVCLTEETTETLYLLGEGDRVVGVSGYTVRPLARIIHERSRVRSQCAGGTVVPDAAGFDTALRAVLKTAPGRALSAGPRIGPKSKPEGGLFRRFVNSPG